MKLQTLLLMAALYVVNAYAANGSILSRCYTYGGQELTDMRISEPEGYTMVSDSLLTFAVNPRYKSTDGSQANSKVISIHHYMFESADGECAVLPPIVSASIPDMDMAPVFEMRAIEENDDADVSRKILQITKADMSDYCNADTAYIYEMVLPTPYKDKYTHCIGVYLRKYAHPAALAKVLITDNGVKNKDQYLAALFNSIRYGDEVTKSGLESERINYAQKLYGPDGYMGYNRIINMRNGIPQTYNHTQPLFSDKMIR